MQCIRVVQPGGKPQREGVAEGAGPEGEGLERYGVQKRGCHDDELEVLKVVQEVLNRT